MGIKSRTFDIPSSSTNNNNMSTDHLTTIGGTGTKAYRVKLTPREKKRVESMIRNAKSLQEIARLEKELAEGRIPGGVRGAEASGDDDDDEDDDEADGEDTEMQQ